MEQEIQGLKFFRLQSPYEEDITLNGSLEGRDIDENFLYLKDMDIVSAYTAEFIAESEDGEETTTAELVIIRTNGKELHVDMTPFLPNVAEYDLNSVFDKNKGELELQFVKDDEIKKVCYIDGLITDSNFKKAFDDALDMKVITRVLSDSTIIGIGTKDQLLGIHPLHYTTQYGTAISFIDLTEQGSSLPKDCSIGDRYVVREFENIYGYLYPYKAVKTIQKDLDQEAYYKSLVNSADTSTIGWRIPTDDDWNDMLNAVELYYAKSIGCVDASGRSTISTAETYTHVSDKFFGYGLGYIAGRLLKSTSNCHGKEEEEGWLIDDAHAGTDAFGFKVEPAGYSDKSGTIFEHKTMGTFWSSAVSGNTDPYNKLNQYDYMSFFTGGNYKAKTFVAEKDNADLVVNTLTTQEDYRSIRLVKEFDGGNYNEREEILGKNFNTVLLPSLTAENGYKIWTVQNFDVDEFEGDTTNPDGPYRYMSKPTINDQLSDKNQFANYYQAYYNGTSWVFNLLANGDSAIIEEPISSADTRYNEYRVIDNELVNVTVLRSEFLNAIDFLLEQIDNISSGGTDLEKRVAALETGLSELRDEFDKCCSDVKAQLEDLNEWRNLINDIIANIQEWIAKWGAFLEEYECDIRSISELSKKLIDTTNQLRREIQDSIAIANDYTDQAVKALSNVMVSEDTNLQNQINALKEKDVELDNSICDINIKLNELNLKDTQQDIAIQNNQNDIVDLSDIVNSVKTQIDKFDGLPEAIVNGDKALQSQINVINEKDIQQDKDICELKLEVNLIEQKNSQQDIAIQNNQNDILSLSMSLNNTKSQIEQLEGLPDAIVDGNKSLQSQINVINDKDAQQDQEICDLQIAVKKNEQKDSQQDIALQKHNNEISNLATSINNLKDEIEKVDEVSSAQIASLGSKVESIEKNSKTYTDNLIEQINESIPLKNISINGFEVATESSGITTDDCGTRVKYNLNSDKIYYIPSNKDNITSLPDNTIMPNTIGGFLAGTTLAEVKDSTVSYIIENLLFPVIYPTIYQAPYITIDHFEKCINGGWVDNEQGEHLIQLGQNFNVDGKSFNTNDTSLSEESPNYIGYYVDAKAQVFADEERYQKEPYANQDATKGFAKQTSIWYKFSPYQLQQNSDNRYVLDDSDDTMHKLNTSVMPAEQLGVFTINGSGLFARNPKGLYASRPETPNKKTPVYWLPGDGSKVFFPNYSDTSVAKGISFLNLESLSNDIVVHVTKPMFVINSATLNNIVTQHSLVSLTYCGWEDAENNGVGYVLDLQKWGQMTTSFATNGALTMGSFAILSPIPLKSIAMDIYNDNEIDESNSSVISTNILDKTYTYSYVMNHLQEWTDMNTPNVIVPLGKDVNIKFMNWNMDGTYTEEEYYVYVWVGGAQKATEFTFKTEDALEPSPVQLDFD